MVQRLEMLAEVFGPFIPAPPWRWFQRHERLWWAILLTILGVLILMCCHVSLSH
jgi:hypothetical protein